MFFSKFIVLIFCAILNFNSVVCSTNFCKRKPQPGDALVAPVYTPLDEDFNLNIKVISKYARYLCRNNIKQVEVSCLLLNTTECKTFIDAWLDASIICGIDIYVLLGDTTFPEILELARYARQKKVSGVTTLPELYFKPKTTGDLVDFVSRVAKVAYPCPTYYYDMPQNTGVNLNMVKFFGQAVRRIKNFGGLKTSLLTSLRVSAAYNITGTCQSVVSNTLYSISTTYAYGLTGTSSTITNVVPDKVMSIKKALACGNNRKAIKLQLQINSLLTTPILSIREADDNMMSTFPDFVPLLKELFIVLTKIDVGSVRFPLKQVTAAEKLKIRQIAKRYLSETED